MGLKGHTGTGAPWRSRGAETISGDCKWGLSAAASGVGALEGEDGGLGNEEAGVRATAVECVVPFSFLRPCCASFVPSAARFVLSVCMCVCRAFKIG